MSIKVLYTTHAVEFVARQAGVRLSSLEIRANVGIGPREERDARQHRRRSRGCGGLMLRAR